MRDQYAGDVSDLLKLALLRALAADDKTVGVGWYYNPAHDGRPDGRHREYCEEPKWKSLDSAVWKALKELPERSVDALEKLSIWPPKTRFHRVPVPSVGRRRLWAMDMKSFLDESSIIFLDPDNGVGWITKRHATIDEIETMRRSGRAVVLIKFPARENHGSQLEAYHDWLRDQTHTSSIVTARTCVWLQQEKIPRFRWFTIIDADDAVTQRARRFVHTLNGIDNCKGDIICAPWRTDRRDERLNTRNRSLPTQWQSPTRLAEEERPKQIENVCPECGHRFKGKGYEGIDAHWRARHEAIMPYEEAWPLVEAGTYQGAGHTPRQ